MPKVVPIITNLTGGEMSPLLDARVDFKKFANGCETLENFIPRPQGGVTKRSGTIYGNEVDNSALRPRLIPFVFSTVQAYVLEFGEASNGAGYMRPWKQGTDGTYGVITSGASPVKIASPYLAADLNEIQYTQTADVLYLFHRSYAPQKLVRLSHTSWSMAAVVWGPSITAPLGVAVTAKGTTGSTAYGYQITAKDDQGNESLPCAFVSNANGNATLSAADYNEVAWSNAGLLAEEVCVYRRNNGIFKYIGNAAPGEKLFKDVGQDYDATLTPPADYQPFASNANFPRCGSFYQDRMWFGGTDHRPQTVWASRTGDHQNLNRSRPSRDDDSLQFTLLSNDVNTVQWLVPGKKVFLAGTAGAEWIMKSSDGSAITPTNVEAGKETFNGVNTMRALPIGSVILFVERFGKRVLEFAYTLESDGYNSPDLVVLAEHLTRDNTLEEWAYAQTPHRQVITVRDDGVAPCLTYFRDHEVVGWWRFITDGLIESVAVIPGIDRDEIWLVVNRTINGATKRYVEILAPTFSNDLTCEDAFFVDCGATLDTWNPADTLTTAKRLRMEMSTVGGLWESGDLVNVYSSNAGSGAAFNMGFASNIGKHIAFRNEDTTLSRVRVVSTTASNASIGAILETDVPAELRDFATGTFARMVTSLSGLDWLEAKQVDILGDGTLLPSKTVTGGAVTLSKPCAKVHVGLNYEAVGVPHPMEAGFQDGTSVGRIAKIRKVGLRLYQTYGLTVGPKEGPIYPLDFNTATAKMGAALVPFSGDKAADLDSNSEASPQIKFVHNVPLPCTVLAIVPRIHGTGG